VLAIFTRNKQSGRYDVMARPGLTLGDWITVERKDGVKRAVQLDQCGKPFIAEYGPLTGRLVCIYTTFANVRNRRGHSTEASKG